MKKIRSQADDLGDSVSLETGVSFTGETIITRQEFKEEADINILLHRFGVDQPTRNPTWGATIDNSIDLQSALTAVNAAKNANFNVPEELRSTYPDWKAVLSATESGEYGNALKTLKDKKDAAAKKEDALIKRADAVKVAREKIRVDKLAAIEPE